MSAANPPQRVYRADLHTHTWDSSDSLANPEEIVAVACRRGVDLLAITDHNVLRTALELRDRYPELIVAGEEIKTTEGEIIGLFLEREIPRGLTPEETIARIRDQGGLVTVPHPLDRLRGSRLHEPALRRVAQLVDAIEVVNARVTFPGDNRRAADFAEQHGLALTAGSDAHAPHEVGAAYALLDEPPAHEPAALLAQLRRARTGGGLSRPTVHFHSIAARWRKRLGLASRQRPA